MKKLIWTIIILFVILVGLIIWQKGRGSQTTALGSTTTQAGSQIFTSADQSITFNYPNNLSVDERNNIITLHHQIKYTNTDACNMKGTATISPTLTDFSVTIQEIQQPLVETIEQIDPTIATSSFSSEDITVSPGFIDRYSVGSYPGYSITEGVEGCGIVTYYLPVTTSQTLVIRKDMVGALSDVADPTNKAKILATPGAISPDQSNQIFNSIVQSLQVQ